MKSRCSFQKFRRRKGLVGLLICGLLVSCLLTSHLFSAYELLCDGVRLVRTTTTTTRAQIPGHHAKTPIDGPSPSYLTPSSLSRASLRRRLLLVEDLVESMRGKRFLVFQADNRLLDLVRYANLTRTRLPDFETSVYGPSILAVSRWARENGYAYILNLADQELMDPVRPKKVISSWWKKAPAMVFLLEIARRAGLEGVVYLDSDVVPHYTPVTLAAPPNNNSTALSALNDCHVRIPFSRNPDLASLEQFIALTGHPEAHVFLPQGHYSSNSWYRQAQKYPPRFSSVNAGVILARTTRKAQELMRDWYLNTTQNPTPFEYSSGVFHVTHEDQSELVGFFERLEDWLARQFPDRDRDLWDPSACTPTLIMQEIQYVQSTPVPNATTTTTAAPTKKRARPVRKMIGELKCRGLNQTILSDVFTKVICNPDAARRHFGVTVVPPPKQKPAKESKAHPPANSTSGAATTTEAKMVAKEMMSDGDDDYAVVTATNNDQDLEEEEEDVRDERDGQREERPRLQCRRDPAINSQMNVWPSDQGRMQFLVLRSQVHGEGEVFHVTQTLSNANVKEFVNVSTPASALPAPGKRLFYHAGGSKNKINMGRDYVRMLMQEEGVDLCDRHRRSQWATHAWEEIADLPAFRFNYRQQKRKQVTYQRMEKSLFQWGGALETYNVE